MKNLKLLSKLIIIIFLSSIFAKTAFSNEPVDIWNIEKQQSIIKKKLKENVSDEHSEGIKLKIKIKI